MQLIGATKLTTAVLLAMIVLACVVALPAGAVTDTFRRQGDIYVSATWHKPAGYTTCKVTDTRGAINLRRYKFNRPGKLDARDCYNYWSSHGHPGLRGGGSDRG